MTHFLPDRTNITVDYKGMNFGESVAYGALGSLTGGSCGLNSVWQMPRYPYMAGGCCSSSNSQILGNAILGGINMFTRCIFSGISDRKEAKAAKEKEQKASEDALKAKAEANVDSKNSSLKTAITRAENAVEVAKTQTARIDTAQNAIDGHKKSIDGLEKAKEKLKTARDNQSQNTSDKTNYDELIQENEAQQKRYNDAIKTEQEKIGKAKEALSAANISGISLYDENIKSSDILDAANKMLEEANKAREDAVQQELTKLKQAEAKTTSSASSALTGKAALKAEYKARKAAEKEAKAQEKANAKAAERAKKEEEAKAAKNAKDEPFNKFRDAYNACMKGYGNEQKLKEAYDGISNKNSEIKYLYDIAMKKCKPNSTHS